MIILCAIKFQAHTQFHLINVLPEISSHGLKQYLNVAHKCLRLSPMQDRTNGFFIACFERGESDPPTRDRVVENRNKMVKKSNSRDHRAQKGENGVLSSRKKKAKKRKNNEVGASHREGGFEDVFKRVKLDLNKSSKKKNQNRRKRKHKKPVTM